MILLNSISRCASDQGGNNVGSQGFKTPELRPPPTFSLIFIYLLRSEVNGRLPHTIYKIVWHCELPLVDLPGRSVC